MEAAGLIVGTEEWKQKQEEKGSFLLKEKGDGMEKEKFEQLKAQVKKLFGAQPDGSNIYYLIGYITALAGIEGAERTYTESQLKELVDLVMPGEVK